MSDDDAQSGKQNGKDGGAGGKAMIAQALIIAVLVIAAFLVGRATGPSGPPPHEKKDNPVAKQAIEKVLETALAARVWTRAHDREFVSHLGDLTPETELELALRLSRAINEGKLKLESAKPAPEPPPSQWCPPPECMPPGCGAGTPPTPPPGAAAAPDKAGKPAQ